MSSDSKLITIYRSQNTADITTKIPLIEALLNSAGIEYFLLNARVQSLIGAGEIGGYNVATGPIEIQVAEENVEIVKDLIKSKPQDN